MIIDDLTLSNVIKVINAAAQHLSLKVNVDHLSAGMPSKNLEALHIEAIAQKAGLHCSLQSVKPAEMQLPAIALNESGKLIFI